MKNPLTFSFVAAFAVATAALLLTFATGCAGRVHLADDTGRHVRQVFDAQAASRPIHAPAHLSADDAKLVLRNHQATFGTSRSAKSSVRRAAGGIRLEAR